MSEEITLDETNEIKKWPVMAFLALIMILVFGTYSMMAHEKESKDNEAAVIKKFKQGHELLCYSAGIRCLVSKQRGWEIYNDNSFTKNDLVLSANRCDSVRSFK